MKKLLALATFLCLTIVGFGQEHQVVKAKFGNGITFTAKDSSIQLKFSARIQNRYDASMQLTDGAKYTDRFYIKRARLKFSGYAFKPQLTYKIEFDMVGARMLDAVVMWNFWKGMSLWVGQTKLPGNIERVISSQNLQFVDRSLLNAYYNLDRDKGLQLHNEHMAGKVVFREILAINMGEGLNTTAFGNGHSYTGRFEILPMGSFTKNGDFLGGDVYREQKPKLAIGGTFDYDRNAIRNSGHLGEYMTATGDLMTAFADFMFKYKGLSIMGEYAYRFNEGSPVLSVDDAFVTGSGINAQLGYMCKSNWEIAGRYTIILPETETGLPNIQEYTLALSKYIVMHSLKVQTDISYRDVEFADGNITWRMQLELSF